MPSETEKRPFISSSQKLAAQKYPSFFCQVTKCKVKSFRVAKNKKKVLVSKFKKKSYIILDGVGKNGLRVGVGLFLVAHFSWKFRTTFFPHSQLNKITSQNCYFCHRFSALGNREIANELRPSLMLITKFGSGEVVLVFRSRIFRRKPPKKKKRKNTNKTGKPDSKFASFSSF